jgi:hypothetical protein
VSPLFRTLFVAVFAVVAVVAVSAVAAEALRIA